MECRNAECLDVKCRNVDSVNTVCECRICVHGVRMWIV